MRNRRKRSSICGLRRQVDTVAGVKPQLEADARRVPGLRLLPRAVHGDQPGDGDARGRDAGAAYLHAFIEEMKASGFIAEAFVRNRIEGASMAP